MSIGHLLFSLLCLVGISLGGWFAIIVGLRSQFSRGSERRRGTECHAY